MRRLLRPLGSAILGLTATACSLPGMEFTAEPLGGVDLEGAGDQLHFDLRNVAGFSSGDWVLVLPPDWRGRATGPDPGGGVRLVAPLEPDWIPLAGATPGLESPAPVSPSSLVRRPVAEPFDARLLEMGGQRLDVKGVRALAEARAREGRDYYFAIQQFDVGLRRYVLYGAAPARAGDDPERILVRLCELQFHDERNLLARVADRGVRLTTGVAAVALFIPVMVVGTLLQGDPRD